MSIHPIDTLRNAPHAVTRSGRRVTRAGVFALETRARVKREFGGTVLARTARARVSALGWIAENLLALHGVAVRISGELPTGPVQLIAPRRSSIDLLAILSVAPAAVVGCDDILTLPLIGPALRDLAVVDGDDDRAAAVAEFLAAGVSVLCICDRDQDSLACWRPGAPIVPVRVTGDVPAGRYLRVMTRAQTRLDVHFGAPVEPTAMLSRCA